MDLRPVALIVGALLTVLSLFMIPPALVDIVTGSNDWRAFVTAASVTSVFGVTLMLANQEARRDLNLRQAFMMVNLAWLSVALFGAIPFIVSDLNLSFTDAFFEAMSGITTTGSTVITGLDEAPKGLLLWRATLQWLGGIGIIVMALSVLPMLQVGGMQLFKVEGFDHADKLFSRATEIALAVTFLYLLLTLLGWVALLLSGMTAFDAVAHAMTSVATGGFSTSDASIGAFNSAQVDWVIFLLMIAGSLPFVLFLKGFRGEPFALLKDSQVQVFFFVLLSAIGLMTAWLVLNDTMSFATALRYGAFNVTSIMTGTGYATADYMLWGSFPAAMMFIIMFVGGCAGSTSCGIKIFRFQVLFITARTQLQRLVSPHGVFLADFNRHPITQDISSAVMGFFFLFVGTFGLATIALAMTGLDFITAVSSAATSIANVGPGLGRMVGPAGTFQPLPDSAKWIMSITMLMGRLELFTVLVLFVPQFWRD